MAGIFDKLNLEAQKEILVVNAPDSFERAIEGLAGVRVSRLVEKVKSFEFALAFATQRRLVRAAVQACRVH